MHQHRQHRTKEEPQDGALQLVLRRQISALPLGDPRPLPLYLDRHLEPVFLLFLFLIEVRTIRRIALRAKDHLHRRSPDTASHHPLAELC